MPRNSVPVWFGNKRRVFAADAHTSHQEVQAVVVEEVVKVVVEEVKEEAVAPIETPVDAEIPVSEDTKSMEQALDEIFGDVPQEEPEEEESKIVLPESPIKLEDVDKKAKGRKPKA
jgi:hypothetical protein